MKAKTAKAKARSANAQLVHFEFSDPAARKVCIAGSFNDWRADAGEMAPMGSGKWVKDLELGPGTYEYRLVIDGKWVTDPRCAHSVPNAFGETNSLLVVGPAPGATRRSRQSAGAAPPA